MNDLPFNLDPNYQPLMEYALRALSRRAHTTHELKDKLKKRPQHTAQLETAVINRLLELKLLDDEEFLKRAVEQSTQRLQGQHKLAMRLKRKGIAPEETYSAWKEMKINEKSLATAALKKIEKKLIDLPKHKRYQKRAQFLANRGFPSEIVFELAKD